MSIWDEHANLAYSTVRTAPSPAISGTTLVLASGQGTLFADPVVGYNCTIWPAGVNPTAANAEIIRVTALAGDTMTIERAQEGSTAQLITTGFQIANSITKKALTDIEARSLTYVFNAHAYGAVGDNVTDDTAGVQAAIDAARSAGGIVFLPPGNFKLTGPLNLTNKDLGHVTIKGAGVYKTALRPAYNGGTVLDLTGSALHHFSDFAVLPVAGFSPDSLLLLARKTSNASAGDHKFDNMWFWGNCTQASVIIWGSEQNAWNHCLFFTDTDVPVLVGAVNMPECLGATPSSSFLTPGTGQGGVGLNTFVGCRFDNDTASIQTSVLVKIYGANRWGFYNCFAHSNGPATYEINGSSYPSTPSNIYYSSVTFDTCEDESALNPTAKYSIWFSEFPVATVGTLKPSVRGCLVKNCAFLRYRAETPTLIDGFVMESGRHSPSVPAHSETLTGITKVSFDEVRNSRFSPASIERNLAYEIRGQSSALQFWGIPAANVTVPGGTAALIWTEAGNFTRILVSSATEQLRLSHTIDAVTYMAVTVDSAGIASFNALGSNPAFFFLDGVYATNGTLTCGAAAVSNPSFTVQGAAASNRTIQWYTGNLPRWTARAKNNVESGADAGSSWALAAYDDAGTLIDEPINVVRAAGGALTIARPLAAVAGTFSGKVTMNNGRQSAYAAKTGTYTIVAATDYCINCTSGTFTVTLPTAVGIAGQEFVIKNSGTGVITVATTSSQTIDGALTDVLSSRYQSITVISDGANWLKT